jgi:thioredoxin reductase (NADPH)
MSAAEQPDAVHCDVLVIGAGPVGLFQVFQLGLQGIAAQVVDALPVAGGQCIELYADKPIYDIPAVPICTGRSLVDRLLAQVAPFAPTFHWGQTVSELAPRDGGGFDVMTSSGTRFISRSVIIAGGVGAFQPRLLKVDGIDRHLDRQLFYQAPSAAALAGRQVLILGGGEIAVAAAVHLAQAVTNRPARVTLMHRRASLNAEAETLAQFQALRDGGSLQFEVGQVLSIEDDTSPERRLAAVQVIGDDGSTRRLPTDALWVSMGLSPKLGPMALWGLAMERRQLRVDPAQFETSTPGIYAVGDVISYPGKRKLILCGFHEATLAAFAVAASLRPGPPQPLLYTTTSPLLHQRLGVVTPQRGSADD